MKSKTELLLAFVSVNTNPVPTMHYTCLKC